VLGEEAALGEEEEAEEEVDVPEEVEEAVEELMEGLEDKVSLTRLLRRVLHFNSRLIRFLVVFLLHFARIPSFVGQRPSTYLDSHLYSLSVSPTRSQKQSSLCTVETRFSSTKEMESKSWISRQ